MRPVFTIHAKASTTATHAPVIAAVRVPPSACSTSQSTRTVCSPKAKSSSMARTLRPIRRWISCVRPPSCARSRGVRVCVARGSIAYSAVIHPSPEPFRHGGTPFSTEAVQRTRVSPKATRHEPSANAEAPRSSVIRRSDVAARPTRIVCSAWSTQLLDDGGGGLTGVERNDDDAPTPRFHVVAADDGGGLVVASLHEHIRVEVANELERSVLGKGDHDVNVAQRGEHIGALGFGANGALRTLESPNGCIAIQSDHERITLLARFGEDVDVSGMEQIEHTVRERDTAAEALPPRRGLLPRHDLRDVGRDAHRELSTTGRNAMSRVMKGSSIVSR